MCVCAHTCIPVCTNVCIYKYIHIYFNTWSTGIECWKCEAGSFARYLSILNPCIHKTENITHCMSLQQIFSESGNEFPDLNHGCKYSCMSGRGRVFAGG